MSLWSRSVVGRAWDWLGASAGMFLTCAWVLVVVIAGLMIFDWMFEDQDRLQASDAVARRFCADSGGLALPVAGGGRMVNCVLLRASPEKIPEGSRLRAPREGLQ